MATIVFLFPASFPIPLCPSNKLGLPHRVVGIWLSLANHNSLFVATVTEPRKSQSESFPEIDLKVLGAITPFIAEAKLGEFPHL